MQKTVFVTGGSGFVGTAVLKELLRREYAVNALARAGSLKVAGDSVSVVKGDLFDDSTLVEGMRGCDAVIHLVGIIVEKRSKGVTFQKIHVEGTEHVLNAAMRAGVRRYIHMSALGTRLGAESTYHRTKFEAEEKVRQSGLDWTIFQPSMIHGLGGEFTKMLGKWAWGTSAPFLFMPYFGRGLLGTGGAGMLQPVHVAEVARAFVDAIEKPETIRQTYELGGAQRLTWPDLHRAAAKQIIGNTRPVLAVPAWYAKALTYIAPAAMLPFNRDQVIMSQEENTCDMSRFVRDFGWTPRGFEESFEVPAETS